MITKKIIMMAAGVLLATAVAVAQYQPRTVTADVGTGTVLFPENLGVRGVLRISSGHVTNDFTVLGTLIADIVGALGFTPQVGHLNLTNWAAITPASKQDASAVLDALDALGLGAPGDIIYRGPAGWAILAGTSGSDGQVVKRVSGYPAWGNDVVGEGGSGDDVYVNDADVSHPNFANSTGYTYSITGTNVTITLSDNLLGWHAIDPSAKQDALGFAPQPASLNLTNWSGITTASKQDASDTLTSWASINPTNKLDWNATSAATDWSVPGTLSGPTISTLTDDVAERVTTATFEDETLNMVKSSITNDYTEFNGVGLQGRTIGRVEHSDNQNFVIDYDVASPELPQTYLLVVTNATINLTGSNFNTDPNKTASLTILMMPHGDLEEDYSPNIGDGIIRLGSPFPAFIGNTEPTVFYTGYIGTNHWWQFNTPHPSILPRDGGGTDTTYGTADNAQRRVVTAVPYGVDDTNIVINLSESQRTRHTVVTNVHIDSIVGLAQDGRMYDHEVFLPNHSGSDWNLTLDSSVPSGNIRFAQPFTLSNNVVNVLQIGHWGGSITNMFVSTKGGAAEAGGEAPPADPWGSPFIATSFEGTGVFPAQDFGSLSQTDLDATDQTNHRDEAMKQTAPTGHRYIGYNFPSAQNTVGGVFALRIAGNPTGSRAIVTLRDASAVNGRVMISSTGKLLVGHGSGSASDDTTDSIPLNTWVYVWWFWQPGTGSDGILTASFSTTTTKPTSGTAFVSVTTANATTDATQVRIGSEADAWTIWLDQAVVDFPFSSFSDVPTGVPATWMDDHL